MKQKVNLSARKQDYSEEQKRPTDHTSKRNKEPKLGAKFSEAQKRNRERISLPKQSKLRSE